MRKVRPSRRSRAQLRSASSDRFDLAAKRKTQEREGRFSEGCRPPAASRILPAPKFIRSRRVIGPSHQRRREFTRKGNALVEAGVAVLSTTTLVPTRARL